MYNIEEKYQPTRSFISIIIEETTKTMPIIMCKID